MVTTWIRTHVTYANVTATLALFIALGGASYAALTLPKNSVGTAQIKNKAVTKAKLGKGVAIAGPRGATGAQGLRGDKGDPGAPGTNGTNGKDGANAATNVVFRRVAVTAIMPSNTGNATATCNSGERLIGGGGGFVNSLDDTIEEDDQISYNGPANGTGTGATAATADQGSPAGWRVTGKDEDTMFSHRLTAYAICASP